MHDKRGEVLGIVAVVSVILLAIFTAIGSIYVNQKPKSTSTRAAENSCYGTGYQWDKVVPSTKCGVGTDSQNRANCAVAFNDPVANSFWCNGGACMEYVGSPPSSGVAPVCTPGGSNTFGGYTDSAGHYWRVLCNQSCTSIDGVGRLDCANRFRANDSNDSTANNFLQMAASSKYWCYGGDTCLRLNGLACVSPTATLVPTKKPPTSTPIPTSKPGTPTPTPAPNLIGTHVSTACTGSTWAWACDTNSTNPVTIQAYLDNTTMYIEGTATLNYGVVPVGAGKCNDALHGWGKGIPASARDGKVHKIYLYAVGSNGQKKLLDNSPQTIQCAASGTPTTVPTLTPTPTPTKSVTSTLTPTKSPTPTKVNSPTDTGSCPLQSQGDINCDGKIDLIDFEIWRESFFH
ncbi:hypothetical protein HGA88_04985 [Candidatus Roizmanbacteria bacterium]|nr:hypothetical protein [Candidatus Roizmanbacteria bacterium]